MGAQAETPSQPFLHLEMPTALQHFRVLTLFPSIEQQVDEDNSEPIRMSGVFNLTCNLGR